MLDILFFCIYNIDVLKIKGQKENNIIYAKEQTTN